MFLFVLSSLWVLVFEYEVNLTPPLKWSKYGTAREAYLVGGTALVRPEHNNVG